MLTCISHFMQFLYLLSVYLTSSLLLKYDVVVILNSKRERKLTDTALIVSLVSLLCFLPAIIYEACICSYFTCFINVHMYMVGLVLFLAKL